MIYSDVHAESKLVRLDSAPFSTGFADKYLMVQENRRLAAIMFTDMVGYSTLTHQNEMLSFELLKEHRALVRPLVQSFRGKEIATPGDAFVVEFTSTVDAVDCAIEIQKIFMQRNAATSRERKIQLRIGIHIGDVLGLDEDIYGDGVNIAARLQPLAPAGTICVSQAVRDQIQNQRDVRVVSIGKPKLKGIKKKLRAYLIEVEPPTVSDRVRRIGKRAKNFEKAAAVAAVLVAVSAISVYRLIAGPSSQTRDPHRIAVLPFSGVGLDTADGYLTEGLTSELISNLSHQGGLRVLANGSVSNYKMDQKTPAQMGRDLNVGSLVEGSIRRVGDHLKVTVSLIDTQSQENVLDQDFQGSEKEIFDIQKKIVEVISKQLRGREIASIPQGAALSGGSPNREAYLTYLKGRYFLNKRTKESLNKAAALLNEAARMDSQYAPAYAALSNVAGLQSYYGMISPVEASAKVVQFATQALALDPASTEAMMSLAEEKAYVEYDYPGAEKIFKRAIQGNPRMPTVHQWYGEFLTDSGRFEESLAEIDTAIRLDPLSLITNVAKGATLYFSRDYDGALLALTAVREMDPSFVVSYYWIGKVYMAKGDFVSATKAFEKASELSGRQPMMISALACAYAAAGEKDRAAVIFKDLDQASKKQYVSPYQLALIQISLGNRSDALGYLERAVRERASQTAMLQVDPELDSLRNDPKFAELASIVRPRTF